MRIAYRCTGGNDRCKGCIPSAPCCWGMKRDCPSRGPCGCTGACLKPPKPIVFLPLMTKPAREVEKTTKYLPEVWMPPCR